MTPIGAISPIRNRCLFEQLASHVAELPGWMKLALDSQLFELPVDFKPHIAASSAELLQIFDQGADEGRASLAGASGRGHAEGLDLQVP